MTSLAVAGVVTADVATLADAGLVTVGVADLWPMLGWPSRATLLVWLLVM